MHASMTASLSLLVLLVLSGCGPGGAEQGASGASEGPWLFCAVPERDFGTVWESSLLTHTFEFEVRGSEPLVVAGVHQDCGCTAADLTVLGAGGPTPLEFERPLAPGTRLALSVEYATRGRRGPSPREVQIFCNEPDGVASVRLLADIRPWLTIEPDGPTLFRVALGEEFTTSFRVSGTTGEPFRLRHTGLGVPPEITVTPVAATGESAPDGRAVAWDVQVHVAPELTRGRHAFPLLLETDVPNPATPAGTPFGIQGQLGLQVEGRYGVQPAFLDFGVVGAAETVSRTVRVVRNAAVEPGVTLQAPEARLEALAAPAASDAARSANEGSMALLETAHVTVRSVDTADGVPAWDVSVLLDGLAEPVPARFVARLVLATGDPDEALLTIPISGARR